MTLVLEHIGQDVGAEVYLRDVSLTLERGTLNVLLGPTLAGKTSLMRADGGARPADARARVCRRRAT